MTEPSSQSTKLSKRAYVVWAVATLAAMLAAFAAFNWFVDPYDIAASPDLEGVNARKTRMYEDGWRVRVGNRLLTTEARTVVLGSSRTRDGFPEAGDAIPGGMENMGLGGANAFELARATLLAVRNPSIDCIAIGVDLRDFGVWSKADATFWLTPMNDGTRLTGYLRTFLSPHAFMRSVQTVEDNITGGSDESYENAYAPEGQKARFEESVAKRYRSYTNVTFDRERLRYLFTAIEAAVSRGVQVRVFIHPTHAWYTEAQYRAGAEPVDWALRAALADAASGIDGSARDGCFAGEALEVWDFGGYQGPAGEQVPENLMAPDPYFYEPEHYRPELGLAVLEKLQAGAQGGPFEGDFGLRLTPATVDDAVERLTQRRRLWRAQAAGEFVFEELDRLEAAPPPAEGRPAVYLADEDWRALHRTIERLHRSEE